MFRFRTKIALSANNSYHFLLQHALEYKHNGYRFLKSTFKHSEPISRDKLLLKIDFLGAYHRERILSRRFILPTAQTCLSYCAE